MVGFLFWPVVHAGIAVSECEQLQETHISVSDIVWPSDVSESDIEVFSDGSVQLTSVNSIGNCSAAVIRLMATRQTFIAQFMCRICTSNSRDDDNTKSRNTTSSSC